MNAALRSETGAWLDTREPAPPPELRARIDEIIDEFADDARTAKMPSHEIHGIASALGESAIHALRHAVARCDERAAAIDLLAADALLTYMMEAAAEQGGEAIEAIADAYGNTRLAQLAGNADIP